MSDDHPEDSDGPDEDQDDEITNAGGNSHYGTYGPDEHLEAQYEERTETEGDD